jgi:alpha-L-fucosidase
MRPGLYRADLDSLRQHRVPDWFADAKLGAFVHWGLFSVPGFAPTTRYTDVLHHDYDRAMVVSPYAEAYANAMRVPGTPTYEFHRATYGDMAYEGFQEIFERQLADWDPDAWAEQFRRSGARYVVMGPNTTTATRCGRLQYGIHTEQLGTVNETSWASS